MIQKFVDGDGFVRKIYVTGRHVRVLVKAAGSTEVETSHARLPQPDIDIASGIAIRVGAALGLEIFGVDILIGTDGPAVVDVNPFPGFRNVRTPPTSSPASCARPSARTIRPPAPAPIPGSGHASMEIPRSRESDSAAANCDRTGRRTRGGASVGVILLEPRAIIASGRTGRPRWADRCPSAPGEARSPWG